jgi:predicted transcriptional regulator
MKLSDIQILNQNILSDSFKDAIINDAYIYGCNKVIDELEQILNKIDEISNTNNLSVEMPKRIQELKELWKNVR